MPRLIPLAWFEDRVMDFVIGFDHRNRWFGIGRSLIAVSGLTVLLFTPIAALTVPVGASPGTMCDGIRAASVLCVGDPSQFIEARRWVMIILLCVVASGYRPRFTAVLQLWVAFTLSVSVTLPDGGEGIGLILALLMLPLCLADDRRWHWQAPTTPMNVSWQAIAVVAQLAVRVQLAFIYLDSAISKFAVDDWSNGTAEYFILRDQTFGNGGPLRDVLLAVSSWPLGTLALTWGAIGIEIAIGLCLLLSWRWRMAGFVLDVALHVMIVVTMGLFSFSLVMVGGAAIAANPCGRPEVERETRRLARENNTMKEQDTSLREAKPVGKAKSALARRIAAGKADPISPEERAIVAELRMSYKKRYGGQEEPGGR
jgi:antimicrobial peptide system SdpB family protein